MDLKTLKNKPKEYRVLSSTYNPNKIIKEMIGKIFEVRKIDYGDKNISLYTKDKSGYCIFKFSEVQEMTPLSFNGTRIGIGDMVKFAGSWLEVYDYKWCKEEWYIETAQNKDYKNCWSLTSDILKDHKPLNSQETITIGENTYLKTAFEEAVKELKTI